MSLKAWIITWLAMIVPILVTAQVEEALEQWSTEDGAINVESFYDELQEIRDKRINLNDTASLSAITFLSPFQQTALKNYIILYGQLLSHKELVLIPGFDTATIGLLTELTVVEPCESTRRLRISDGHHSLITNIGGSNFDSLSTRMVYKYNLGNKIDIRLAAEKDANEAWGKDNYYSYHLILNNIGILEKIIIGRYSLQFGQGLTLWTGLAPFNLLGSTPIRFGTGVRQSSTFFEEGYQEGVALTLRLSRPWRLSTFASRVHGTNLLGGHAEYRNNNLTVGMTLTHTSLDDSLKIRDYVYNMDYFRGKRLYNAGMDMAWQWNRLIFYGEAAVDDSLHIAAIGGAKIMIDSRNTFGISYRHYDTRHHNLFAQPYAIGEGRNENGWTLDAHCRLPFRIDALLSADIHNFPSLRYASHRPSTGTWLRAQLSRELGRNIKATIRYAWRSKQRNIPNIDSNSYLWEETVRQQLQGQINATLGRWQLTTSGVIAGFDTETGIEQHGWLISQQARYSHGRLQATVGATYFDVEGFYARIYLSESNLQYAYSMPMYNGRGLRTCVVVRYHLLERLDLSAKYTIQHRNDYTRHAATLQIRWKF